MTRRVRFTPLGCLRTFGLAAMLLAGGSAEAGALPFAPPAAITTIAGSPQAIARGDIDRDGDLDLLVGHDVNLRVEWLEDTSGDGSTWMAHTITTAMRVRGVELADVDRDGDLDAVAAAFLNQAVVWFENTAGNGSAWTLHTVSAAANNPIDVVAADVDRDGDLDVLASGGALSGTFAFYENADGNGTAWTTHTLATLASPTRGLRFADVDRDGDLDVLGSSPGESLIAWYENVTGDGETWTARTITTVPSGIGVERITPADVDGDGDADVIAAFYATDRVDWFENPGTTASPWTRHPIATQMDGAAGIAAADMDGDGDLDAVSSGVIFSWIRWHENVAGNGTAWATRTVGTGGTAPLDIELADLDGDGDLDVATGAGGGVFWSRNDSIHQTVCFAPVRTIFATDEPYGSAAVDVDRDGDTDVLSMSSIGAGLLSWHRNDGGAGAAWTPATIATALTGSSPVDDADVDGDGDVDVLFSAFGGYWAESSSGGTSWQVHTVVPIGPFNVISLMGADIDGDGDLDGLVSPGTGPLSWFENQAGGTAWVMHTVATVSNAGAARAADLDRDGDLDLLIERVIDPTAWFENVAGNGSAWVQRTISAVVGDRVGAVDLDSDGDLDVVAAGDSSGFFWHENVAGNASSWSAHTISTAFGHVDFETRDLDADGDVDLLISRQPQLRWLEQTGPGVTFVEHSIATTPNGGAATSVRTPDIDGDATPDALWTIPSADRVVWNPNRRGQVLLSALDQVPAGVANGNVFSMLRLTVTHGGRAGDSDAELARINLLLEEEPGDPLTSVQANALIEELRVYHDANGNGTFDAGDALVTTVPTLTVSGGIQSIVLPDGHASLQLAPGASRAYFVVAQIAANADQQPVNHFRVTHLATGPSATQVEDRSADTPLTIACPADLTTVMIGPVVPVELTRFTIE